jgi:galactose-1-phosphate uridylyltransferase
VLPLQQDVDFQNEKHMSIYAPMLLASNFHLHLQLIELPVRQSITIRREHKNDKRFYHDSQTKIWKTATSSTT